MTLAVMHGSSYSGDGGQALRDLATVMREVLGPKAEQGTTSLGTVGGASAGIGRQLLNCPDSQQYVHVNCSERGSSRHD